MKWISVKDRLPEGYWCCAYHEHLSEAVLIANNCSVNIGFYNRAEGIWYTDVPANYVSTANWIDKITHWMPLPKNPHAVARQRRHKGGEDALDK